MRASIETVRDLLQTLLDQEGLGMTREGVLVLGQRISREVETTSFSYNYLYSNVFTKLDDPNLLVPEEHLDALARFAGFPSFVAYLENKTKVEDSSLQNTYSKYRGILKKEPREDVESALKKMRSEWT